MPRQTLFRALAALMVALGLTTGCDDTTPVKTTGLLELPVRALDFQKVCVDGTASMELQIRNSARATLTVNAIEINPPIFAISSDTKLPLEILGNSSETIRVSFTPTRSAQFNGTLTVKTDAKEDANQTVTLLGQGFQGENKKFEISCICERGSESTCGLTGDATGGRTQDRPCLFLSFDNVPNGTFLERTVRLENNGCEPLDIQGQFLDDPFDPTYKQLFSSAISNKVTLRGGETRDVVVRFSPTSGSDPVYPDVGLKLVSNDPNLRDGQTEAGAWKVNMIANSVAPQLVVDPDDLSFFTGNVNQTQTQTFTISNAGTGDLRIDSVALVHISGATTEFTIQIEGGASAFTLAPAGAEGDSRKVTVSFTPTGPGTQKARVLVKSDSGQDEVNLVGGVEPNMVIEWLDPTDNAYKAPPIDFGPVATGAKGLTRTVRISNTGRANLVVNSVVTRDPNGQASPSFKVPATTNQTIPPGQSITVEVTMDDNLGVKDDLGKFVVSSNDPLFADAPNKEFAVDIISLNEPNVKPVVAVSFTGGQRCMELTLDATGTIGPEAGDTLTYEWSFGTMKPSGTAADFEDKNSIKTRVITPGGSCQGPDKVGAYDFQVKVTDQYGNFSFGQVRVVVQ